MSADILYHFAKIRHTLDLNIFYLVNTHGLGSEHCLCKLFVWYTLYIQKELTINTCKYVFFPLRVYQNLVENHQLQITLKCFFSNQELAMLIENGLKRF